MMKMKYVVGLLGLLFVCADVTMVSAQFDPWSDHDKEYIEKKTKVEKPRFTAPVMLYKDSKVRFEAPNTWKLPADAQLVLRMKQVQLLDQNGKVEPADIFEHTVEIKLKQDPPANHWRRMRNPKRWKWVGEVTLSPEILKAARVYDLTVEQVKGDEVKVIGSQTLSLIKDALEKVDEDYRPELETWLDDLNTQIAIWGKVPTWPNLSKAWQQATLQGKDPYADLTGFMLRSYYNPQIKRQQPYTVYMPKALDQSKPMPLMILLHGSGGTHRNIIADYAAGQRFEEHPMIIANAGMFKHQEYRHMALNDILWIIEDMKKKYNIDESRIYLQGISLGGRGTLEAAALKPDIFAAISAHGVYGVQEEAADPFVFANKDPFVQQQIAKTDIRSYLPNLYNTPTEIIYGWTDPNTPPSLGLLFGDLMRIQGSNFRARGFDTGHNLSLPHYDWATTRKWLLKHQLDKKPERIHHRVSNTRFGKNKWIEITGLNDYSKMGEIIAQFDDQDRLLIRESNISEFLIHGPLSAGNMIVMGRKRALTQHLALKEGELLKVSVAKDEIFEQLIKKEEDASETDDYSVDSIIRQAEKGGPIWDIWSSPVIYTFFESGDADFDKLLMQSAGASTRWDISAGQPNLPFKAWKDLSEDEKKKHNLIIFVKKNSLSEIHEQMLPWPKQGTISGVVENADILVRWMKSPWSDDQKVLLVEFSDLVKQPILLSYFGSWDAAFWVDWFTVKQRFDAKGRLVALPMTGAGVYTRGFEFGDYTTKDFRSRALLGEAARPTPKREKKKDQKKDKKD